MHISTSSHLSIGLTAAALALVLLAGSAPAATDAGPRVRLVSAAPLSLAGSGFAPREKVKLTVKLRGTTHHAVVTAGPGGRFVRRFALARGRCDPLTVSARGNRGSRVSWTLNVPDCSLQD